MSRTLVVVACLVVELCVWPGRASAQFCADCLRWTTRVDAGFQQPGASDIAATVGNVEPRRGAAVTMDLGRRLSDSLEIQAGGGVMAIPLRSAASANAGNLRFVVSEIHVGAIYHFERDNGIDFFAGPLFAGFTRDTATDKGRVTNVSEPGAVGVGVQAGLRLPVAKRRSISMDATVRWHAWRSVNPWLVLFGIAIRH